MAVECQFGFSEPVEDPPDLDPTITYYQLDEAGDTVFPLLLVRKLKLPDGPDDWRNMSMKWECEVHEPKTYVLIQSLTLDSWFQTLILDSDFRLLTWPKHLDREWQDAGTVMRSCRCTNIYYICIMICLLPQGPAVVPPPTMGALPPHTESSYRVWPPRHLETPLCVHQRRTRRTRALWRTRVRGQTR